MSSKNKTKQLKIAKGYTFSQFQTLYEVKEIQKKQKESKQLLLKEAGISDRKFYQKFVRYVKPIDTYPETINFDSVISFIESCKEISLIREIQIKAREKRQELEENK